MRKKTRKRREKEKKKTTKRVERMTHWRSRMFAFLRAIASKAGTRPAEAGDRPGRLRFRSRSPRQRALCADVESEGRRGSANGAPPRGAGGNASPRRGALSPQPPKSAARRSAEALRRRSRSRGCVARLRGARPRKGASAGRRVSHHVRGDAPRPDARRAAGPRSPTSARGRVPRPAVGADTGSRRSRLGARQQKKKTKRNDSDRSS